MVEASVEGQEGEGGWYRGGTPKFRSVVRLREEDWSRVDCMGWRCIVRSDEVGVAYRTKVCVMLIKFVFLCVKRKPLMDEFNDKDLFRVWELGKGSSVA